MSADIWLQMARDVSEAEASSVLWSECYRFWALPSSYIHADWGQKLWSDVTNAAGTSERVHRIVSLLIAEHYSLDLDHALPLTHPPSRLLALLDGTLCLRLIHLAGLALLRPRMMRHLDTRSLRPAISGLDKECRHFVVHEAPLVFKGGGVGDLLVTDSGVIDPGCVRRAGASLLRHIFADLGEQGLKRLELKLPRGTFEEWEPAIDLSAEAGWEVIRRILRLKFSQDEGPSSVAIRAMLENPPGPSRAGSAGGGS